jgi:hypothetical protein
MDDHPIPRYITKLREKKKIIPMEDDQTDCLMKNRVARFKFR